MKNIGILAIALYCLFTAACSIQEVKPWERNYLAQKKMQLVPSPLTGYLDDHIYYSKESASGGAGVGGGGCGCN